MQTLLLDIDIKTISSINL